MLILENTTNADITEKGVTIAGHSVYISVYGGSNTDIARAIYNKLDAGCGTCANDTEHGGTPISYNPASDNIKEQPDALYNYVIQRPTPVSTGIVVTVSDLETETLTNAIKRAVVDNFNGLNAYRRVKMGDVLYASRFYADVIKAGVEKLETVQIKYPKTETATDVVSIDADEIPTISVDDVTVVYSV